MKKKIDFLTGFTIKDWNLNTNSNKNDLWGFYKAPNTISPFFHFQILIFMGTLDILLVGILIGGIILVGLFLSFRNFYLPLLQAGHTINPPIRREQSPLGFLLFFVCFAVLGTFLLRTFKSEDEQTMDELPTPKREITEQKQTSHELFEENVIVNQSPYEVHQHSDDNVDTTETSEYYELEEFVPNELISSKLIQISANDSERFAKDNAKKLKNKYPDLNVYLYFDDTDSKYKIWIGDFESELDAQQFKQQLQRTWRSCFIVNILPDQKQNAIVI